MIRAPPAVNDSSSSNPPDPPDPPELPDPSGASSPERAGAPAPDRVRRSRRLRRWLLGVLIAGLALPPLAWVLRESVTHPLVVRAARWALPRFTPYELELAALHGDWFTGLELEGLKLAPRPGRDGDDAPLRLLTADRAELRWRWRALLREPLAGLDAVELGSARLELDLTRGSPQATATDAQSSSSDAGFTWPAQLPAIDVGALDLELGVAPGAGLSLRGASLQLVPEGPGRHRAECSVARASWEDDVVRATGPVDLAWRAADGRFEFDTARWQGAPLLDGVALDLANIGRAEWSADGELLVGDARAGLRVEGDAQGLELGFDARGLDLEQLATLVGSVLRDWDGRGVAGRANLTASAQLPYGAALDGTAELTLEARRVVILGRRAEELNLEVSAAERTAHVRRGELREGPNELVVRDLVLPLEWRGAEEFVQALDGELHLEARDLGLWVAAGLMPDRPGVPAHELVFDADLSNGQARVERGELVLPGGRIVIERGLVAVGDALSGGGVDVELVGRVDLADLTPLEGMLGSAPWSGSLAGDLALSGRTPELELEVDLTGSELVLPWFAPGELHVLGRADTEGVAVQLLEARGEFGSLSARGALAWRDWNFGEVRVNADITRPELVPGMRDLSGAWHLEGDLHGPLARIEGGLQLSSEHLDAGGAPFDDVHADVLLEDGEVVLRELRAVTPAGPLLAAGRATGVFDEQPLGLELERLELSEGAQRLTLVAPARVEISGARLVVDEFLLEGPAGRARGSAEVLRGVARVDLELDELDPGAWLDPLLPAGTQLGRIDARFHLERDGPEFTLDTDGELDLDLQPLPPGETPLAVRLAWAGRMAGGRLELERLTAVERSPGAPGAVPGAPGAVPGAAGGAEWFALQGGLPLDPFPAAGSTSLAPGPLDFGGRLALPAGLALALGPDLVVEVAEPLTGELALSGAWRALEARLALAGRSLRVRGPAWSESLLHDAAALDAAFVLGAEGLTVERLRLEIPERTALELSGTVGLAPDVVELASDPGRVRAAALALEGSADLTLDGALARELAGVRRLSGRVTADARIGGTLGAPEIESSARLADGELRLTGAVPTLSGLAAELRLDGDRLQLEHFRGEIGGAPFEARGALTELAGTPTLELFLEGENLLLARSEGLRVRADCKLALRGPLDDVLVTGDVALRNSRLSANIDPLAFGGDASRPSRPAGIQLFSLPDPPLADLRFDIAITTAEPFVVRSNFVSGSLLADLHLAGTGAVPLPEGRIFLKQTRARLPAGTIKLPGGVIEFRSTDPFVPRIDIRGETRLAGHDVNLQLRGPYHDPEILLSSNPPLPNYDLLSLLLTGRLPVDNEGSTVERATESMALFLARDAFTRNFMGPPGDGESLLDRFEYSTGREISRRGNLTSQGSFRIGDSVLREGDSLYMTGERDKYDEFNFGLKLLFRLR